MQATLSTLPKSTPKGFTKLASAPTLDGIKKTIGKFYCSDSAPEFVGGENGLFSLRLPSGKVLSTQVQQTSRGFYFGHF